LYNLGVTPHPELWGKDEVSTILAGVLTVAEVAARHRTSATTVLNAIRAGQIPAEKFGRQLFIHQDDADRWAETRKGAPR
jgi:excisionase family DNA binding protein